jgi:hypothetical protein
LKAGIITIALLMFGSFSQSLARKHDPSDVGRLVDLGPMLRFKDMNRDIPGLGSRYSAQRHMPRMRAAISTRTPWLMPLAAN